MGRANLETTRRTFVKAAAATAAGAAAGGVASKAFAQDSTPAGDASLVIYCGRSEGLVGGLIPNIEAATGLKLDVRFGNTAELAAQILEEGDNSPAGLYFGQDAGALGALAKEGRFAAIPEETLAKVDERFRSPDGVWTGVSGRARVLVYNPNVTDPATLPASIYDLPTAEVGSMGWAPTNASFQTYVTALRVVDGEDGAKSWLEAMIDAGTETYEGNNPILNAVAEEEITVGLINHYYLYQARKENPEIAAENYYFPNGDIGSLINVAGVGVIAGSGQEEAANLVVDYLLSDEAQTYFAQETSEYPLVAGIETIADLPPIESLESPDLDLTELDDLEGTITLLTEVGLI